MIKYSGGGIAHMAIMEASVGHFSQTCRSRLPSPGMRPKGKAVDEPRRGIL